MSSVDREKLRQVLAEFGIASARRALISNATEEVILLTAHDYSRIDVDTVSSAIAAVLSDKKIAVVPQHDRWRSEPI
jgi:molybdopterin-guanine dinucleotide biosynthesis protein A